MANEIKNDISERICDEEDLLRVAGLVASIPDRKLPAELIPSVMTRVRPKRLGKLRVWWRRMQTPVSLVPLRAASVAGSLALAVLLLFLMVERAPEQTQLISVQEASNPKAQTVVFSLKLAGASRVELIGSFNHWRPGDFLMKWNESRKAWMVTLDLDKGRYEYAFLVDGEKVLPDPSALVNEDDGFGNRNSVLVIERNGRHEAGI